MARYPLLVDHRIDVLRLNLFLRFLNCLDALSLVDSKADLEQLELLFQLIEELLVCQYGIGALPELRLWLSWLGHEPIVD